jgi:Tol biopolymer transport system component
MDRHLISDADIQHPWFTPDGKRVVYQRKTEPTTAIQIINVDGAGERTIFSSDEYMDLEVSGISDDGKTAAVGFHRKDGTWQVGMVSLETGKPTILVNNDWRDTYVGNFSPDGRWLVYSAQLSKQNYRDAAIYVVATDGSSTHLLVPHAATLPMPLFTPDGSRVVFISVPPSSSDTIDLSSIRVANGNPSGAPPEVVMNGIGRVMGFARDGSLYYRSNDSRSAVYVAEVDPATWKIGSVPRDITDGLGGKFGQPAWSPNGKVLAFAWTGGGPMDSRIVLHSFEAASEREVQVSKNNWGQIEDWSRDGKSLLIFGGGKGLRSLDTATQSEQVILRPSDLDPQAPPAIATDGRALFYLAFDSTRTLSNSVPSRTNELTVTQRRATETMRLKRHDLQSGIETELYHATIEGDWGTSRPVLALSPDGSNLAFWLPKPDSKSRSLLIQTTSGEIRGLPDLPMQASGRNAGLTWTNDSRALLFIKLDEIWVQRVDGTGAYPTGIRFPGMNSPRLDPDGHRIAFIGSTPNSQVWAIKNLFSDKAK